MTGELVSAKSGVLTTSGGAPGLPSLIVRASGDAKRRYLEFFAAQIRNRNTREAYIRAVRDFLGWVETDAGIADLLDIEPLHVAAWIELRTRTYEAQSVKQKLSALRHLFDWLVTGHVLSTNPASFVRGPKFSYTQGKTPILTPTEARQLLRSIPTETLVGLRDRALIGLMVYTFARISAALTMNVKDVYRKQETLWVRLHEKGGKRHEMPCQHNLKEWMLEYIEAADLAEDANGPLFRSVDRKTKQLGANRLDRQRAWAMVKRRALQAGLETTGICNHTFRGTGITAYLENPEAKLEHAQQMAAHSDPKTTRLYDRRSDKVSLDEVERIGI
ncbi:MAG: tyrosine-type recombinase/integrase [Lamprobacter sp.]|uniref:tyrosine-type recombinase/integrase n=1 Tax=Lamprobacter sp. TaxID=3100796 RepID=UPI002B260526|nr:tyrosine-type recombinase/integrase [Lamprobacter sp.]MEA3641545.1 tyrosine-type recombinase/integrase [Lamprobacter sp.]